MTRRVILSARAYLAVFVSSDDMSAQERKQHTGADYAAGMLGSTFCWIPRGDNPTSRRVFDAVAAGCIPVVVSDDIARYLPFRWAGAYKTRHFPAQPEPFLSLKFNRRTT